MVASIWLCYQVVPVKDNAQKISWMFELLGLEKANLVVNKERIRQRETNSSRSRNRGIFVLDLSYNLYLLPLLQRIPHTKHIHNLRFAPSLAPSPPHIVHATQLRTAYHQRRSTTSPIVVAEL